MIKKFSEFMEEIKTNKDPSSKIMIYHDTDADGLCSATLIGKYLSYHNIDYFFVAHPDGPRKVNEVMIKNIEEKKPTYLIICDLAYDDDIDNLLKIKKEKNIKRILIIDHHKINKKVNYKDIQNDILVIKPQFLSSIPPEKYPTSKLMYDLLINVEEEIKKYWWISAIGIVGDGAYNTWKHSFLEGNMERENITMEDLFVTEERIDFAVSYDKNNISKIMDLLYNSKNIFRIKEELASYDKIKKEVERIIKDHIKEAEIDTKNKYLIYEIKSPYGLRSRVANILSLQYPDYVVVVYGKDKDDPSLYVASFRSHLGKVDVAHLIKELSKEIKSLDGGGHKPAAGASFKIEDKENFLKKLKKKISEKK